MNYMNLKNLTLLFVMAFLGMSLTGCNAKKENTTQEEMARGSYSVEKNQVTVVPLERKTFNKQLICNGKLEAYSKVNLQFAAQGVVAGVNVTEGAYVKKGAVMAYLNKEQAERQLEQAELSFDKAELNLADRLLDYGYALSDTASIPAEQKRVIYINTGFLDAKMALENAEYTYRNSELKAPFDGKVANLKGREFEQAGQFCTLIYDSKYYVRFSVLETEYSFVSVGQAIKVSPFADASVVVEGKVVSINPTVDSRGQIAVTAVIQGGSGLIDGMNVRVLVENSIPDQLVVPKSAVVIRDNLEVLFRYVDGRSLWTYVNVLMSNTEYHVIEANADRGASIEVGDLIVTSGNLNLGDDTPIEIAE